MNTPAHLLIGAAVMGRSMDRRVVAAAFIGALLPDLSLYLLAGGAMYVLGITPSVVFNELYFSDAWQTIFAIDNSFILWGMLLGIAVWRQTPWAIALTGAALLHLCLDFPVHHDDGRAHFWPLSNWVFESPISYWDRSHGAGWVAPIEGFLAFICAAILLRRGVGIKLSVFVLVLASAELWIVRQWLFFFIDS